MVEVDLGAAVLRQFVNDLDDGYYEITSSASSEAHRRNRQLDAKPLLGPACADTSA